MTVDEVLEREWVASRVLGEPPVRWWLMHASVCDWRAGGACNCAEPVYFSNVRHVVRVDQELAVDVESIH